MAKKGERAQGMPLNIIIIAVILLIVLVVILSIFSGNISKFSKDLQSCGSRGGRCETKEKECPSGEIKIEGAKCAKNTEICCIRVFDNK